MASQANLTVFDGAAVPVIHILTAAGVDSEKGAVTARWREMLSSVPTEAQVSATLTSRKLPSGVLQIDAVVNVPVMESISGQNSAGYTAAPKVAFSDQYRLTGFAHPRSTVNSRRLARMIMANLLNNVSTSVAAATSGPFADAFDSQIMPS